MRPRTLTLLAALCALGITPAHAVIINGVDWLNAYQPNAITNNNLPTVPAGVTGGAWTLGGSAGTSTITDDYLTITTATTAENRYYSNSNNWSGSNGMTVEMNLQIASSVAPGNPAAQIRLGGTSALSTNRYIYLNFFQNSIAYTSGATFTTIANIDLTSFTTLRFTLSDTAGLIIYANNNATPLGTIALSAFATGATGTNNVIFGDITGTGTAVAGGTSNWNYIAYTQGIVPVPEPQAAALLGIAVATLATMRFSSCNRKMSA